MAAFVCPPWVGYLLLSPLRKFMEDPQKILGRYVKPGMTVLEPGCGMGYFTLPLSRMVGSGGRVIAVDLQPKMLAVLSRRAAKAGLADNIELRQAQSDSLGIEDLKDMVDFAAAIHVVHEMPDQGHFFSQVKDALKPGGRVFVREPGGHVSRKQFAASIDMAHTIGFAVADGIFHEKKRSALLLKLA
jgi:ubiquinone/menaquinone biosynthesis C-methylase UbiE